MWLFTLLGIAMGVLQIQEPQELVELLGGGNVATSIANFGHIPYGRVIHGQIQVLTDEDGDLDLCEPIPIMEALESNEKKKQQQFWLIATRGNCTFTTKVKMAQQAGASMAVIVDNQNEMVSRIVMIDDGRGLSVHIPSVLIPKDDGEKIIEFARDQKVNGIMLFNVTRKEEKANVTFGLNIENRQSFKLMRDFEPYLEQFQKENKINFDIFYQQRTCLECIDQGYTKEDPNCLGGGRYCSLDPDGPGVGTGRDLVQEQLRQLCLFEINPNKWLEYFKDFDKNCLKPQLYGQCFEQQMSDGELVSQVEKCYRDSFNQSSSSNQYLQENTILERQLFLRSYSGIIFYPGAVINNITYRGNPEAQDIVPDICSVTLSDREAAEVLQARAELLGAELVVVSVLAAVRGDRGAAGGVHGVPSAGVQADAEAADEPGDEPAGERAGGAVHQLPGEQEVTLSDTININYIDEFEECLGAVPDALQVAGEQTDEGAAEGVLPAVHGGEGGQPGVPRDREDPPEHRAVPAGGEAAEPVHGPGPEGRQGQADGVRAAGSPEGGVVAARAKRVIIQYFKQMRINKPLPPDLPSYVPWVYFACFLLQTAFHYLAHPILHCVFCISPLVLLMQVLKNRLTNTDLGALLIYLSLLAECLAHFFHQFQFDQRLYAIYFIEHLCCATFVAFANCFYYLQRKVKKKYDTLAYALPKFLVTITFTYAASLMLEFLYPIPLENVYLYFAQLLYVFPLNAIMIFSFSRYRSTSSWSFYLGLLGSGSFYLSDVINFSMRLGVLEEGFLRELAQKLLHRCSYFLLCCSALEHLKWLEENKFKFL